MRAGAGGTRWRSPGQIMTTPEFFPTDSVPYVFDQFRLLGRVPDRIWDDNLGLQPTGTLPLVPAQPSGLHYGQLPLDRTVVRFPQSGSG